MTNYQECYEKTLEYFDGDELAAQVYFKYALTTPDGEILEPTPEAMHRRLAKCFYEKEKQYPNPMSEEEIFSLLDRFKYIVPQGSPMSAIGNPYRIESVSNCFVVEPPTDSYGGILHADQQLVQISKRRGGVGIDISKIRPKGMPTSNAAKTTDGIGVFMERFSNSIREVGQSGRRGALMITISVHHPEIETFINIKKNKKKVTGANISIKLTDEFMQAVKSGTLYEQRFPVDSSTPSVTQLANAKDIWDQICQAAWESAEPGVLFWDRILEGPADQYEEFRSESTNPSLRGDSLVLTDKGVFEIQKLVNANFKFKVKNMRGEWHDCKVFESGKNKQLYKITLKGGHEIFCTPEHKWPLFDKSGKFLGKQETQNMKASQYISYIESNLDNLECKLSKEDGFILGWNVGDGWITWHKNCEALQYGFIFSPEDCENKISEIILNKINSLTSRRVHLRENKGCFELISTDKNVRNYFESINACHKSKGVPKSVWTGNKDFINGFLDGLLSSDGHIDQKRKNIVITTAHEKLAQDLQKLFLFLGVRSNNNKSITKGNFPNKKYNTGKQYTSYRLKISINGILRLKELGLTLSNTRKQKAFEEICENNTNINKINNVLKIKSIEKTSTKEDVYDITVYDDTHTFVMHAGVTGNCGELPLVRYDSCRLLVMNTYSYVKDPFTEKAKFDHKLFAEHTQKAQRLMDDLIDIELDHIDKIIAKINSDQEPDYIKRNELDLWQKIREKCARGRRTGLGVTAVGDTLAALGIKYGSTKSKIIVGLIYDTLCLNAYISSCIIAKERGAFPAFDTEIEKNNSFVKKVLKRDSELQFLHDTYGRRNISLTTTAPAGSVSCLTQTTSGIEPAFLLHYKRRRKITSNDESARVDFVDDLGDKWQEYDVYHHGFKKWMDVTGKSNIEESPYYQSTANDINWEESVDLQAAAQKWICHSISKTCNVPKDVSVDLIKTIYMKAWESGCKGFTVYRDGCRDGVLLSTETENKSTNKLEQRSAPKRPEILPCDVYQIQVNGEKWTVFVGLFDKQPYEVFAGLSKYIKLPKGTKVGRIKKNGVYSLHVGAEESELVIEDLAQVFENSTESAFTRTVSLALRHGTPVQFVVEQIEKGASKDSNMFSLSKGLARVLKNYIKDGTKSTEKKCSNCKAEDSMIYEEGCSKCVSCGYSKCG